MEEIFNVHELAEYLKMNPRTLQRKARKGEIPTIKIGRQYRFDKEQIQTWLSQQTIRKPLNILVVDDEPLIGQLFKESLNKPGYRITTTLSSIETLELINTTHFDLIFLDLFMPDPDGAELFRRIRQKDKDVPIVIITGYPDSDLMGKAMEYGPFLVMKKPFTGDDILEALNSYTRSVETKRQKKTSLL